MKYKCLNCNYIYDEEKEALNFNSLSAEWICPECGASKSDFELMEQETDPEMRDNEDFKEEENDGEAFEEEFEEEDY